MRAMVRKYLVVLMVTLALGAIASASASASQWYVGGKALTASEKLAETVKVEEALTFSIPTLALKTQCTGLSADKPEITTSGTLKVRYFTFSGCSDIEGPKGCKISSEFEGLETSASLALGTSPADKAEFGGSGFGVEFTSCGSFSGPARFTGKLPLSLSTGQQEQVEQSFLGEGTNVTKNGLTLNYEGNDVYVTGKLEFKLASGAKWSFH
jgi:hypothetical protein